MANNNWAPQAVAIQEVITVTVGGTLSGETFQLGLGGQVFAEHTDTTTVIENTVDALIAAWNASTHPWAAAVTASKSGTTMVVLTADVAGVPFGDFLSDNGQTWETGVRGYYEIDLNTPGGLATLTQDETTANRGPNCANLVDNWSAGTYLADDEDVTIADNSIDILWGLDYGSDATNKVTLYSLDIRMSYTGKIGLDYATFNGATSAPEYRGTYFKIMVDKAQGDVTIGEHNGPGTVLGSRRIKLDLKDKDCRVIMHGSNSQPFETGKPAVRILTDDTNAHIQVRGAPGGFGLAMDQPGETSVANTLSINCSLATDRIFVGPGVKLSNAVSPFQQKGGHCILRHKPPADILAAVKHDSGELETKGDFRITAYTQEGGVFYPNHYETTQAVTTANFNKGVCDTTKSARGRNWGTVNQMLGEHTLRLHGTSVAIQTFNLIAPGGQGPAA